MRRPGRFWTYSKDGWTPGGLHRWGLPSRGGDEWGRRTVVVGLWFAGYLVWAWRTCWCAECHEMRLQTYGWRWEDELERTHRSAPRPVWQYGLNIEGRVVAIPQLTRITPRVRRRLLVPVGDWEPMPEPSVVDDGEGGANG